MRRRGRPPAFDRQKVLHRAAETFWRMGYEGTSISDLTAAMGITTQSLYAAFSSKANLYKEALAWYQATIGATMASAVTAEADCVDALTRVLREAAQEFTRPGRPHGCMVWTAGLNTADENEPVAAHVARLRQEAIQGLQACIEQGIAEGQLRQDTDPASLARFTAAIIQGMSAQAQDGALRDDLLAVADHAAAAIARRRAP